MALTWAKRKKRPFNQSYIKIRRKISQSVKVFEARRSWNPELLDSVSKKRVKLCAREGKRVTVVVLFFSAEADGSRRLLCRKAISLFYSDHDAGFCSKAFVMFFFCFKHVYVFMWRNASNYVDSLGEDVQWMTLAIRSSLKIDRWRSFGWSIISYIYILHFKLDYYCFICHVYRFYIVLWVWFTI